MTTEQAKQESGAVAEITPGVPDAAAKPLQGVLGRVPPIFQRFTGVVLETHATIEKRLGFCPFKALLAKAQSARATATKVVSEQLDTLADGLHQAASRVRALAAPAAPEATAAETSPEAPRAMA